VLHLNDPVVSFEPPSEKEPARASIVVLRSGQRLPADSVILGMGVKPEVGLAKDCGLEIGKLGGIRVNEHLQTSEQASEHKEHAGYWQTDLRHRRHSTR